MGLFDFLWRILFGGGRQSSQVERPPEASQSRPQSPGPTSVVSRPKRRRERTQGARTRVSLDRLQYESSLIPTPSSREVVDRRPYLFADAATRPGKFLDLTQDSDRRWLDYYGLPPLKTPDDLAAWLKISIGELAWLTYRTSRGHRAETERQSHYVYRWLPKKSGGWRLIESPKPLLKQAQQQILREILDHVPAHGAVHGFVKGRSILTNAVPHVGQRFVLKFDLEDFYSTVRYSRVVAIFRSLGFSREVGIWLARLTTNAIPWNLTTPATTLQVKRYTSHHLPQGAATSPALANLSAFGLDIRLAGMAKAYGLQYTRYADDLTFSGPGQTVPALNEVIPLVQKIVRSERFVAHRQKRRVIRDCQRQTVTGVVVNEKLNCSRADFDELKAVLHNCVRYGPTAQNRAQHPDFAAHLQGRIAHVVQLNATRGAKLRQLFEKIDWSR